MITEKEIAEQLRRGKLALPPLSFRLLEGKPVTRGTYRPDALIEASWRGVKARFVVEFSTLSTPKGFQGGLNQLRALHLPKGYLPMLIFPFLNEGQLGEMEQEGISGIDLCGNGVVVAPGKFFAFRSGEKNRFPSSAPIKNVYRKNSSLVGRTFFVQNVYRTVQELCAEINRHNVLVTHWQGAPITLSTVSKTLKVLEEDLLVDRSAGIRLLRPGALLEKLKENYVPPKIGARVRLKIPGDAASLLNTLREQAARISLPLVAAGTSSVSKYAVMPRGDMVSVYCPRLDWLLEQLQGSTSDRFPNLELIETEDPTVYFDAVPDEKFLWASPVQVYLELMAGDKRDREMAEQVKSIIVGGVKEVSK